MKTELMIFNNEDFGQIRIIEVEGKCMFVANDVAKALGYSNPSKATNDHCRKSMKAWGNDSLGRQQEFKVIPEGDIYRLISKSQLPSAEQFESWVFDEVLPTLRKTGSYETSKQEKGSLDRFRIMEMNARTRMANMYLKLSQVDTLSPTYKTVLVSKASQVLSGEELLPLPKSEKKVYAAKEIGDLFGISSNKVGRIANQNNLKTGLYGEFRRSKSEHSTKEVDTWVYYDTVIPVFREILGMEVA